ncbi:hypothetical protein [Nitrosomonas sp. sh817]|uniref:hypothetical protein n=1 Tax=unclassified Nitrosomonas TaxID=2609265 RepID=UPI0027DBDD96|nr:hypothetical protein [Nitrosomonas sp. sh817]WMJ08145.1 hypothetical protein RBH92_12030 [Nitrosomonas sp. sh817]
MSYWFHPDAESEFNQAIDYYEEIETGLGYDFAIEVYTTIQRSLIYPNAWPVLEGDIRRCLVRRFPYGVLFL